MSLCCKKKGIVDNIINDQKYSCFSEPLPKKKCPKGSKFTKADDYGIKVDYCVAQCKAFEFESIDL